MKTSCISKYGPETKNDRRAAKQPPTRTLKLSIVTPRYREGMIPLSRVRLNPKTVGYMGAAQ